MIVGLPELWAGPRAVLLLFTASAKAEGWSG